MSTMTVERIMIWKFDEAPTSFRGLYHRQNLPQWVALVPASIYGADVDDAIRAQSGQYDLGRYEEENGDIVYIGSSPILAGYTNMPESNFVNAVDNLKAH